MPMGFTKKEAESLYKKVQAYYLEPQNLDNEFINEVEMELFCNLIAGFMLKFKDNARNTKR